MKVIGPGAVMAATSIGGGEWLVGPAAAVKYGTDIFLIATVAIVLQVLFNLEGIRYTLYTGEPIYGGIMRLRPGGRFWAGFYSVLGFFQLGWPALAGSAAAALFAAWMGRMPGAPDQEHQAWITTALILAVVLILSFGGTIERMLEYFAWTMLGVVFLFLIAVNVAFVPAAHWWQTFLGFFRFSGPSPAHRLEPHRRLRRHRRLRAASATSPSPTGCATRDSAWASWWARSPARWAATRSRSRTSARSSRAEGENLARWREWLRYVHLDQIWVWGLFCFLGMYLNVNLATAIIPHGTDLQGLAAGAYQAQYLRKIWPGFWFLTLFNGFWILFKTQLGNTDILVRTVTDAAWMARQGRTEGRIDIRKIYYGILVVFSHLGRVLDPDGLAVPALQDPGQHGGHRSRHRRHPDRDREPALPPPRAAARAVARDGRARGCSAFYAFFAFFAIRAGSSAVWAERGGTSEVDGDSPATAACGNSVSLDRKTRPVRKSMPSWPL